LYRLKTPSHQIALVLAALAEGLDPSAAERVFGYRQATIITWLTRAGKHAEVFHERCFRNLHIPHLQLDELRTRLRSSTQVLWLWLAIDPRTKILPVLHLGPRVFDNLSGYHLRLCSTLRDSQPRILRHVILIDGRPFTVYLPELFITNGRNSYVCATGEVLLRPRQRASNP
jgi:hypothetical protein